MRDIVVSFIFDVDGSVELVLGEEQENPYDGWSISPHAFPSLVRKIVLPSIVQWILLQVSKSDVDTFGALSPPSFPSILITISADHNPSTVRRINYSVPLKGIESSVKKIYIVQFLSGCTGKNFTFYWFNPNFDIVSGTLATPELASSHQPIGRCTMCETQ